MPRVAIAAEFLEAFASLPKAQCKKVREFLEKFQKDPTSHAINYEKLHGMKDDRVRTVRIGLDYRAIVIHPREGDVHVLMWVDHHDEAMEWASRRVFDVHPVTGALQVTHVESLSPQRGDSATVDRAEGNRLFQKHGDGELFEVGVPRALIPAVRAVSVRAELDELSRHLPEEAREGLRLLLEGVPPEQVVREVLAGMERARPVEDSRIDLDNPHNRRRFVVVDSAQELQSMLDAPLEKWRVFLHPSQRKLVEQRFSGPARALGGAGTGKTVVLMHRARQLARTHFTSPADRVLVTTFSANLATTISEQLDTLCGDERARIDVANLDAWAIAALKQHGKNVRIASEADRRSAMARARDEAGCVEWSGRFLEDELDLVVEAQDLRTLDAYVTAPRIGRGARLARADRARVWRCFEIYKALLGAAGKIAWLEAIRRARTVLEGEPARPYRAVLVDEAQDFHPEQLRLVRALVAPGPDDVFLVGDAHQRIYARKASLGACGIDVRGRGHKLKLNYRTTDEIRRAAVAVLGGVQFDDLDGGADPAEGYYSLLTGIAPELLTAETLDEELDLAIRRLREVLAELVPEDVCVTARTHQLLERLEARATEAGIVVSRLSQDSDRASAPGVRVGTMHRIKGLEFRCVFIVGLNEKTVPLHHAGLAELDPAAREDHELRERSLLHVAITRARERVILTSHGKLGPIVGAVVPPFAPER